MRPLFFNQPKVIEYLGTIIQLQHTQTIKEKHSSVRKQVTVYSDKKVPLHSSRTKWNKLNMKMMWILKSSATKGMI